MNKEELVIVALQQRIAEIVAQNEIERATLRADFTVLSDLYNESVKEFEAKIDEVRMLKEELDTTKDLLEIRIATETNCQAMLKDAIGEKIKLEQKLHFNKPGMDEDSDVATKPKTRKTKAKTT